AQSAEPRTGRCQADVVVERLPLLGPRPRDRVEQAHDRAGRVEGVDLVADAVLSPAVVNPAPAPRPINAVPQDSLAHPAVRVDALALLNGRFLPVPPPVVGAAAPRSA